MRQRGQTTIFQMRLEMSEHATAGLMHCLTKNRFITAFGEAMHKSRQDVAANLLTQHKTACLLTLLPLACHKAAYREPVKRRFIDESGRRGSNPRQPAWKAGRREIDARLP